MGWRKRALPLLSVRMWLAGALLLGLATMAQAQILQRGTATSNTSTSTALTINKPAGVVQGDVLLANIVKENNGTTEVSLSGWTVVRGGQINGGDIRGTVLYKIAGSNEPASYQFALGSSTNDAVGTIVAFSGVDVSGSSPFDAVASSLSVASANGTTATASAITTTTPNCAVLMFAQSSDDVTWSNWSASGTLTEISEAPFNSSNDDLSVGVAWAIRSVPGSTGNGTVSQSTSVRWGALLVALKPANPTATAFTSTTTWTAPAGVTSVVVECWGGGGGGSTITSDGRRGGGGGGGAYARKTVTVTPGQTYNLTVGAGGNANSAGGDSWFKDNSTVLAKGGSGGSSNSTSAGSGGSAGSSIGDVTYSGGNGAAGGSTNSGGGGGGAGSSGAGGIASANTAGAGTEDWGGSGGSGVSGSANGNPGSRFGGGGSGACTNSSTDRFGGPGAPGLVIISPVPCPTFALSGTTAAAACTGSGATVSLAGTAANLPVGTYTVTYDLSSPNAATGLTASMTVATAGSGSFTTANLASTGSTTVTITNLAKDGCSSAISANRSSTFTVVAPTAATIAYAGSPYCSTSGTASVNITGTTGGTFSSTPGLSLNSSTGAVNLSTSTAGTYTVTYTYGSCSATTTASITVSAPPTASNAGPDQAICASTASVSLAANNPTAGTGAWSIVSGPSTSTAQFSSLSSRTATFTPAGGAGSYVLRWTISNAPCTASSDEVTITVNAAPTAANAGPDQAVCAGSAATLAANTPSVGTGAWSIVSGPNTSAAQFSSLTAADASFTPTVTGSYTLRWTISSAGCTNSTDDVVLTSGEAPSAFSVAPASASICAGQPVSLAATLPAQPGGVTGSGTATNANTAYPSPYGAYYETQRVQYLILASELSAMGFGPTSTITSIGFTVSDVASSGLHVGYTIKLANTAATDLGSAWQSVDATANFGPVDYVPTAGLNVHSLTTPFTWDGSSNVVVDICHNNDPNNAGDVFSRNARVAFTTTAFTSVHYRRADNVDLCGTTDTPTANSTNRANMTLVGANTYSITWSPALGLDVTSGTPVVATPASSTVYTATLSQAGVTCTRSVEVPISVSGTAPGPPTVTANGPTQINVGDGVSFTADAGGAPITWYDAPTEGQVLTTGSTYSVASACTPGTYTVYAGTEAAGCASVRSPVSYTVRPLVSSDPLNGLICSQGGSVNLTLNALNASGITWSPADGLSSTSTAVTTASHEVTTSYSVSATVPGCGSVNASFNVGVIEGASFTPTAAAEEVCAGAEVSLAANLSASGFSATTITHAPSSPANATVLASGGTVEVATTSCTFCPLDDAGWEGIPLGFTFNFFGNTYSTVNVGTNGLLQFGAYNAAGLSDYTFANALPNAAEPLNIVAGVAVDLNATSGTIRYWTEGLAPTRIFVMQWLNVPGYNNNGTTTSQIKLFETTGIVEVHVSSSTSTAAKVVGLQNADASIGSSAFSGTGSITNQAWRFVPGAEYSFQWSQSGQAVAGATDGTYTFNAPAVPGAYTYAVAATNPVTGCVATRPVGFTVNEVPAAPVVTPEVVYCQGATAVALSASGAQGNTLRWYTQPTGGTPSTTAPTPSTASVGSTAYYVSQITAIGCESPRDTITVVVNPSPAAPAATAAVTYCQNAIAVPLEATATAGNTLKWYTVPSGGTGSTSAPTPPTANTGSTSWYVAQVSGTNSCESPRTTVTVTVNATPDAPTVTSPVNYCQDAAAVALTATASGGNTLAWFNEPAGGSALPGAPVPSTSAAGSTMYYVQQSTAQGCASVRAMIEVAVAPTITPSVSNSASSTSACGGSITFTAIPSNGGDAPSYQWFLNNTAVSGATQQTYVLNNPVAGAQVRVRMISNAAGCLSTATVNSNTVTLTGESSSPSVSIAASTGTTICPGTEVTFSVAGSANMGGAPTYQWRLNGQPIGGATSSTYTTSALANGDVVSLTMTSSLNAQCLTSSTATSAGITFSLNTATTIVVQPASVQACPGTNATFTVQAAGSGTLQYQWRRNGVNITNNASALTASLTLGSVAADNVADYDVVVMGTCGSVTSSAVPLTLSTPTAITSQPVALTQCGGTTAQFSVVAEGQGTLSYQWRKAGASIPGATDATLVLTNIGPADAAAYSVLVTGACGAVTSASASLTVNPATTITAQPAGLTVCNGTTANLAVTATGGSPITYQWSRNGVPVQGATSSFLSLPNVQSGSAGSYTVAVSGSCGAVTSEAAVLVVDLVPTFSLQPISQTVCAGSEALFVAAASGSGTIAYQWRFGADNIAGATTETLSVADVNTGDVGSYTVVATGSCGSTSSAPALLEVKDLPVVACGSYASVCPEAADVVLGGTPSGGTWSGTGVSGSTAAGFTFDPSVGTQQLTYTIVGTNDCVNSCSTTITVFDPPVVSAGTYGPVCIDAADITLAGMPSGGTWSGVGVSGTSFDPSLGTQTLTYNYTDGNGCSSNASTTIVVNELPVVSAGNYGPVCIDAADVVLVGTPAGGTWSGTGVSGSNFDPSVGTQTLTYSYSDANGCSSSASTTIVVNELPVVSAGSYGPVCIDAADVVLVGSPAGGTWSGTGVSSSNFDPSVGTQTLTYNYTDGNGCSSSASTTIVVNELPVVSAGTYGPVCIDAADVALVGSPAGGTWSGVGVNGNLFDPSVGTQTLTYSITDGNGCANSAQTTITVNPLPNVSAGSYGPVCIDAADVALVGSPAGGTWSGVGVNGNLFDPSVGTQTLTYSYSDANGCSSSASTTIVVNELPVVSAGSYGPVCIDAADVALVGSPAGGTWSGTGVTGSSFDPSAGTQTLTYTFTDANDCTSSAQTTITVNELPEASIAADGPTTFCSGGSVELTAGTASAYAWSNGSLMPAIVVTQSGSYTVTVTGANGCTATSAAVQVTVNDLPQVVTGTYPPACASGGEVTLGDAPSGGTWSGTGITGNSFDPSVGTRTLTYTYTNADGCTNSASVELVVFQAPAWYADADGDGAGDASVSLQACEQPQGFVDNSNDQCPDDANKTAPGACGCGVPDEPATYYADADGDGLGNPASAIVGVICTVPTGYVADNSDLCDGDPNKSVPGQCGCGVPDTDTDNDGTANCNDGCPDDLNKTAPGQCGCGVPDTDSDSDGTADCNDLCPNDPSKTAPGECGCGVPDVPVWYYADADGDGYGDPAVALFGFTCDPPVGYVTNNTDECVDDPQKQFPGQCGCGNPDTDTDGDGLADCVDGCPDNPLSGSPGLCGCGMPEEPVKNLSTNEVFCSIQAAIDDSDTQSGHVLRLTTWTYTEALVVNKSITLRGANADVACGARGAESIIAPPTGVPVTVAADDVIINGVKLVAPSATRALSAEGRDGLNVRYNVVEQVGTAVSVLPVRAIDVDLLGLPATCTIERNCVEQVGGVLHAAGATGISVRNTSGLSAAAQVHVINNVVDQVTVGSGATGEAARGIVIEAGAGMEGVLVQGNTVQGITGPLAHAIVLHGPTPQADVLNNKVHGLTAEGSAQGTGVLISTNSEAGSIDITGNGFTATALAIHNQMGVALATATCNWFGSNEPVLVRAAHSGPMEVVPWLIDGTETLDGQSAPGFHAVGACSGYPVTVSVKAVLQGAYDATTGLMRDNLRANGLLPLSQPYGAFLTYNGNEQVRPEVLAVTGPDAVVDWVLLEVRSAAAPNVVTGRRAALLQRDGDVVDLDGVSPVRIWQAPRGIHHIAVRHRNHLGAMSLVPQYFGGAEAGAVDLATGAVFGTNARRSLADGVSALWSGNTSGDGALKYSGPNNDRDPVLVALPLPSANAVLSNTYHRADINLDGVVKYTGVSNDRDPILQNIGGTSPTAVRVQQLP